MYDFFWGEFADWYLEVAKLQLAEGGDRAFYTGQTLVQIMDLCLRMLHPFTPYITEELWGHLKVISLAHSRQLTPKSGWPEALIISSWPETRVEEGWEVEKVAGFNRIQEVIRSVRNWRAEQGINPRRIMPAILVSPNQSQILREQSATIARLARIDAGSLKILEELEGKPESAVVLVVGEIEIYLPQIEIGDRSEERSRLDNELAEATAQIHRLETLLAGLFAQKAPADIVQKEQEKLAAYHQTAEKLHARLKELETRK